MEPRNTAATDQRERLRPRIGLAFVFLLYLCFQCFFSPIGATDTVTGKWLGLALVGVVFTQPLLFGMWAALAPGRFIHRGSLTLAALALTYLGGVLLPWNLWQPTGIANSFELEIVAWEIGVFLAAMTVFQTFRKFAGWRVVFTDDITSLTQSNQFSLRFLLGITTGSAFLLGLGRIFGASYDSIAFTVVIVALTFFPVFVVPLTVISNQLSYRVLVLLLGIWIVLTWLAVELISAQDNAARAETVVDVLFVQIGAIVASLSSATILRFAGFRFVRPTRSATNLSEFQ